MNTSHKCNSVWLKVTVSISTPSTTIVIWRIAIIIAPSLKFGVVALILYPLQSLNVDLFNSRLHYWDTTSLHIYFEISVYLSHILKS